MDSGLTVQSSGAITGLHKRRSTPRAEGVGAGDSTQLRGGVVVTVSSSACTNEPSGEDLCTGCVAVIEKVLKSYGEILIG